MPNLKAALAERTKAGGQMRAYSVLEVKAVTEDEDNWTITGIASTPTPDRMEDVVVPTGAKFKLPLPLLWQHDSTKPIGRVMLAKSSKAGIPYTAVLPKVKEAGVLQDRINEAIQSIKYQLVTAVSIGFRALNNAFEFLENGGLQFNEWEWLELSVVTIPANAEATIQTIKSYDAMQRKAALGQHRTVQTLVKSGATGTRKIKITRINRT